jgi:lipopolysaccharide transport system ATP-binding protein
LQPGEALGIIGRNGAGKSTLLKILSRITEPTEGRAAVRGRVGSLLEIGTGFHPELTGRENIFLNGAVLGMTRSDIRRRFDEIVSFSGVERFLDTSVKYYSSGMYMRLAFAVAAHLEPDILIVDEVLAVGDAEFHKKCVGKMSSVAGEGRTVLFVSHNLGAVSELCSRAIWLDRGRIRSDTSARGAVLAYVESQHAAAVDGEITGDMHVHEPMEVAFTRARLLDGGGRPASSVYADAPLSFELELQARERVEDVRLILAIESAYGSTVALAHSTDRGGPAFSAHPGTYRVDLTVDCPLSPGRYTVHLAAKPEPAFWGVGRTMDWVSHALEFEVHECTTSGAAVLPLNGPIQPQCQWRIGGRG